MSEKEKEKYTLCKRDHCHCYRYCECFCNLCRLFFFPRHRASFLLLLTSFHLSLRRKDLSIKWMRHTQASSKRMCMTMFIWYPLWCETMQETKKKTLPLHQMNELSREWGARKKNKIIILEVKMFFDKMFNQIDRHIHCRLRINELFIECILKRKFSSIFLCLQGETNTFPVDSSQPLILLRVSVNYVSFSFGV